MAGEIEVGRAAVRLILDDSSFWKDVARLSSATVKDIKIQADADTAKARAELKSLQDETNETSRDNDTLSRSFGAITGGLGELASGLRNISTLIKAARIPFLLAGLGAIPAIATSAAVAVGQLALGLSQGLVGGLAVVGTAFGLALGGIKAYLAISKGLIDNAIEVKAGIDAQGLSIDQVRAKYDGYIYQLYKLASGMEDLKSLFEWMQRRIGADILREFNRAIGTVMRNTELIGRALDNLNDSVTTQIHSFITLSHSAERLGRLESVLIHMGTAAGQAAKIAKNLFFAFLAGIQPVLPMSVKFLRTLGHLSTQMRRFAESAKGQQQIASFFQNAWRRAQQLWRIVVNLGKGFRNLFSIIAPGTNNMMKSLENLSRSFSQVGAKGTESRRKIQQFVNQSKPILKALGNLVGTLVREFFKLAGGVAKMEQGKKHVNTLANAINGLAKAIPPVRRLLQQTFKDLGPTIGPLAKQVARFFKEFAGSTDVLVRVVKVMTQLLRTFNKLPDPVKKAVAELVALRIVSKLLGVTILVKLAASVGKVAAGLLGAGRRSSMMAGALGKIKGPAGTAAIRLAAVTKAIAGPTALIWAFTELTKKVHTAVINILADLDKKMGGGIKNFVQALFKTGGFGLVKFWRDLPGSVRTALIQGLKSNSLTAIWLDQAKNIITSVKRAFGISSPSTVFAQIGRDIVQGMLNGIAERIPGLQQILTKLAGAMPDWVKKALGISSPSKVFAGLGRNVAEGFAEGILRNAHLAESATRQMALRAHRGALVSVPMAGMGGGNVRYGDVHAPFNFTVHQGTNWSQTEAMMRRQFERYLSEVRSSQMYDTTRQGGRV